MAIPTIQWLRRIAIGIVVVVALALPWVISRLWELVQWQWDNWVVIAIVGDGALLLLVAIWWLWWRLPRRQLRRLDVQIHDPKARADTEDNFRKTVGQALGGVAVLVGAACREMPEPMIACRTATSEAPCTPTGPEQVSLLYGNAERDTPPLRPSPDRANAAAMSATSASRGRNTVGLRPWRPGESGNKNGRPPAPMDLSLLCREHAPEAIEKLLELLRSDDKRAVAWAIGTIFDRAFGKPLQKVEATGDSVDMLHLIAAKDVAKRMQAALDAGRLPPPPDERGSVINGTRHSVIDVSDPRTLGDLAPALE